MRHLVPMLHTLLAAAYPLAVWWGLAHFGPRSLGLMALAVLVPLMALRMRHLDATSRRAALRVPLSVMGLLLLGVLLDDVHFMLVMPVLISVVVLVQFAASLCGSATMIERFARMHRPELDAARRAHCRQATVAWCVFLAVNAMVAGTLAFAAPVAWWAAYSGGIAYVLMGGMFVVELAVRVYRFGADDAPSPIARLLPGRDRPASSGPRVPGEGQ